MIGIEIFIFRLQSSETYSNRLTNVTDADERKYRIIDTFLLKQWISHPSNGWSSV